MENEEKKVEETAQEVAAESTPVAVDETTKEIAKEIAKMIPEHATIQKVDNGFIISIPGQKHRIANNLEEVIAQVSDIFSA
jgi:uncharacterized Fe-S cluster-containing protein